MDTTTFPSKPALNWPRVIGLTFLVLLLGYWTNQLIQAHSSALSVGEVPWIFLDSVNLIFHEAGHWLFMLFGEVLNVLGGSLTQILIPLIIGAAFWRQKEWLGLTVAFWWVGESLTNLSYYIADARVQDLPLLGGDSSTHDWHWLLGHFNWLKHDAALGGAIYNLGVVIMLGAILVSIVIIFKTSSSE